MAAVVVTHDAQLATWADRTMFLRDGHVTDQRSAAPSLQPMRRDGASPAVSEAKAEAAAVAGVPAAEAGEGQ
jgi:ABC-type polar amino acid transport system ATPase subunit